ncbi:MAG: hypothetical protein KDK56_03905 [Simkania sp.]|nr:hypothetical protein [Simkania sp.]MCB1075363.1 hypothetical protein [Simkania sp.]
MKPFLVVITVGLLSLCASLSSLQCDQKIQTQIQAWEYSNEVIQIEYEGNNYPIRIITNPKKESLWGGVLVNPSSRSLYVVGDLPLPLVHHLEDLLTQWGCVGGDAHIDLRGKSPLTIEEWGGIHPVRMAQSIEDALNDAEAKRVFLSTTFENKVLYYKLNGKPFQVRLLYNPEGRTLSATRVFRLEPGDPYRKFTISWDKKYAVFVDERAPQELIDHLVAFAEASTWEWWFNFSVSNGTCVEHRVWGFNQETIYYLDTWFEYSEDFS